MVLNPNGIEPTFLKLDSWSPGAGIIPIITSDVLNYIKKKNVKFFFYLYKKHSIQFLKMGSIPCWVQFHAYPRKVISSPPNTYSTRKRKGVNDGSMLTEPSLRLLI